jgi:hypothetical protein
VGQQVERRKHESQPAGSDLHGVRRIF